MAEEVAESTTPDPKAVELFWNVARNHLGHANLEFILGQDYGATEQPPWMQLAEDADQATQLANQLSSEKQITTKADASSYPEGEESLPLDGSLVIICDGTGKPVALARTKGSSVTEDAGGRIVEEKLEAIYTR